MTYPDKNNLPKGSIDDTGLAAFATKTQYTWQSELRDQLLSRFLPVQLGFFNIFGSISVAQQSANFANVTNIITKATSLKSGVTNGVAVSDPFSGAAASDFGASWSRTSDGAGAGTYGPNGTGSAVWTPSGFSDRRHVDRYTTPLFTNIQAVMTVMSKAPNTYGLIKGVTQPSGFNYLLGRIKSRVNSSGETVWDTFVYCRIGHYGISIGKCVNGTWYDPWTTIYTNITDGDQFVFILGTNNNVREFVVLQNGYVQIQYTDVTSSDTTGKYVGMASQAVSNNTLPFFTTTNQVNPGQLDVFAAADRQSAIV